MIRLRSTGPRMRAVRAVTGMRGVGKTQLAAAYARERVEAGWRLVAWVDASDEASLLAGLAQVAVASDVGSAGEDARVLAAAVRQWLEADGEQRLLVFDDVNDPDVLRPFVPGRGAAQVVITSSHRSAESLGLPVPVNVFTNDEALTFLVERTGRNDPSGAAELAGELGHLPLALALAAATVVQGHLTYQAYLSRLRSLSSDGLKLTMGPYPHDIAQAVLLTVDAVAAADKSGRLVALLDLISVLSSDGVPRTLLDRAASARLVAAATHQDVDTALGQLANASLLSFTTDGARVSVHRLVSRVVRERHASDGTLIALGSAACELLTLAQLSLPEPWQDRTAALDFVQQVTALNEHLAPYLSDQDIELVAKLLRLRGWALRYLLDLDESAALAVELGEPLLEDRERVLGESHPDTLASLSDLASAYLAAGRVGQAVPLYERALADRERVLGESHPDTLASRNNLASAYEAAGRVAEAVPLYEEALAGYSRVLGESHPATLRSRGNLASAYQAAGRVAEALRLLEAVLADRERVLGESHPDTLRSRGNLASAYQAAGRVAEAVPLLEAVLADRERMLGESHPDTLVSRNNLASAYRAAGRVAEAVLLLETALTEMERVLGPDHPDTILVRQNLKVTRHEVHR